ncbi:hypothetical protein [Bacillus cereus group sp. BfR-BA-01380]|uniref:hypothetical protein n=1 Tax=Bacillus cereus group sp. BfR-BA-01380 TaxID=2920324 RepID=UPI001F59C469|nr:hypothetical protein [Bacillus cereus group sp. BfR-BA-01380]
MKGPTNLKRKNLDTIPTEDLKFYIVNEQEKKAIRIPKEVQSVFNKLKSKDKVEEKKGIFISDLLAMAIKYRRLSNTSNYLKKWESMDNGIKPSYYPQSEENMQISKLFAMGFYSDLFVDLFTHEEIHELEKFLFRCPPNYDLSEHIYAHNEFKPILT